MKFRIILWIGAMGSVLFMLCPLYASSCVSSDNIFCSASAIYIISIFVTLVGGFLHAFFNYGILYYLTSLSKQED
jgi:hypothetical protein